MAEKAGSCQRLRGLGERSIARDKPLRVLGEYIVVQPLRLIRSLRETVLMREDSGQSWGPPTFRGEQGE